MSKSMLAVRVKSARARAWTVKGEVPGSGVSCKSKKRRIVCLNAVPFAYCKKAHVLVRAVDFDALNVPIVICFGPTTITCESDAE